MSRDYSCVRYCMASENALPEGLIFLLLVMRFGMIYAYTVEGLGTTVYENGVAEGIYTHVRRVNHMVDCCCASFIGFC